MSTPTAEIVKVHALTKQYGSIVALHNVTLGISSGTIVGLIGPQGSGKTTLLNVLAGLVSPTAGRVQVEAGRIGALIDHPTFHPGLSGRHNLEHLARLAGLDTDVDVDLQAVDLTDMADAAYRTYSMGTRQRLGIAAALLGQPDLILLDEPTNGLDPWAATRTWQLLRSRADQGATVIVATHHLDELETHADDLAVLRSGRLLWHGHTNDLCHPNNSLAAAVQHLLDHDAA